MLTVLLFLLYSFLVLHPFAAVLHRYVIKKEERIKLSNEQLLYIKYNKELTPSHIIFDIVYSTFISTIIDRAKLKVERLLRALETQLSHGKHYVIGDMYTIADISIWPWVAALFDVYDDAIATCFDNFKCYPNVMNWYNRCMQRVASKKAFDVCTFQDEGLPTKAETNAAKHYGEGRKIPLGDASGKAIGLK